MVADNPRYPSPTRPPAHPHADIPRKPSMLRTTEDTTTSSLTKPHGVERIQDPSLDPAPTPYQQNELHQPDTPRGICASEVTPEQVGIYTGDDLKLDPANPHNITKASLPEPAQTDGLVTNDPKEFDPRMLGEAEPGPLELPPSHAPFSAPHGVQRFDKPDAGEAARGKVKDRSLKARAKRFWMWLKFFVFFLVLIAGALLYWQYTVRKHTYVVEPRICFFETADKQVRLTGTRYYSYTQNEMLGVRWAHNDETQVKTELDIKGSAMVIASLGGPDGPTSKYISNGELGKEVLPVAETYVITFDKRSVILNASTFCR